MCHHNRLTPSSDNLQKLSVGYSMIKIFVRQPYFVGDNTKGTSKTCQYVPGLHKDRSHSSLSLATLCSTTIHKVGNYREEECQRKDQSEIMTNIFSDPESLQCIWPTKSLYIR